MDRDIYLNDVLELAGVDTPTDKDLIDELGWDAQKVFELMSGLYDKGYFGDEFLDEWAFWDAHPGLFGPDRLTLDMVVGYLRSEYPQASHALKNN